MKVDTPVIYRTFLGGHQNVTWQDFVYDVVQDDQTACQIARQMLEGDGTHNYGSAEEGGFEMFEIIDRDALKAALSETEEAFA